MYELMVKRDFTARHALIGGDYGPENQEHAHYYTLELLLSGSVLGPNGFLVDIVEVEAVLDAEIGPYRDRYLNDLPAFAGINPSLEVFARMLCEAIWRKLSQKSAIERCAVRLWESPSAWASFTTGRE